MPLAGRLAADACTLSSRPPGHLLPWQQCRRTAFFFALDWQGFFLSPCLVRKLQRSALARPLVPWQQNQSGKRSPAS
jgi:hypothetical protein